MNNFFQPNAKSIQTASSIGIDLGRSGIQICMESDTTIPLTGTIGDIAYRRS